MFVSQNFEETITKVKARANRPTVSAVEKDQGIVNKVVELETESNELTSTTNQNKLERNYPEHQSISKSNCQYIKTLPKVNFF